MLEGKAIIGDTDMLAAMQQHALHLAAKALDFFDVTEPTDIARLLKKVTNYRNIFFNFVVFCFGFCSIFKSNFLH